MSRPSSLDTRKDARLGPQGKYTTSTLSPGRYRTWFVAQSNSSRFWSRSAKSLSLRNRSKLFDGRSNDPVAVSREIILRQFLSLPQKRRTLTFHCGTNGRKVETLEGNTRT